MSKKCDKCSGKGYIQCSRCLGKGLVKQPLGHVPASGLKGFRLMHTENVLDTCPNCKGKGAVKCSACKGKGVIKEKKKKK